MLFFINNFREIINSITVFLHFINGTHVFFQLSIIPPAFNANYNRNSNDVFAVILSLNSFKTKPWSDWFTILSCFLLHLQ